MTFLSLIIFLLSSSLASAISATSLSPCYNTCNGERTHPGDVVCGDNDYNDSSQGQKFKACLSCESTSTAYNNVTDNDIYWFLFNMKYSAMNCLFVHPTGAASSNCRDDCGPLKKTLSESWFHNGTMIPQYQYCGYNHGAFVQYAGGCASCLQRQSDSKVLGNFLTTMQSACSTKPNASDGETVSIPSTLFVETDTGLSTGAKAGIGVGAGVAGLIILGILTWIYRRYQKRRRCTELQPEQANEPTVSYEALYDPAGRDNKIMQPAELQERGVEEMAGNERPIQEMPA